MATGRLLGRILALCLCVAPGIGQAQEDERVKQADGAYEQGDFGRARPLYETALASAPESQHVLERLAFIRFFSAEYAEAIPDFRKVAELDPLKRRVMLAYVASAQYLMRDYAAAAATLEDVGDLNLLNAEQVRLLAEEPPYEVSATADQAVLPFLQLDPLPVVEIEVNSERISVLIDTGGAQLILDSEFADQVGVRPVSEHEVKGFAGGKTGSVSYGITQSVRLGEIELRRVPVWVLPTRRFSSDFGRRIDGILGTEILRQFLPTLDYIDRRLILRLKTEEHLAQVRSMEPKARVPFVIDGIHCMYAPCSINGKGPVLMYFDSGMADDEGACLSLMSAALEDLGLPKPARTEQGEGGGGAFHYGYVEIESVQVGELVHREQKASFSGTGASLLTAAGYKTYGLLSHNFLKHYRWTIDFDARAFLFDQ